MEKELITCKIDPQKMWVHMAVNQPENRIAEPIPVSYFKEHLRQKGVVYGIDESALEYLAGSTKYGEEIVVAQGKKPEKGIDGFYEYFVNLEDKKAKPVVAEDGTVDYLNSLEIAMVEEGQAIAKYHPPTPGEPGVNVYGEEVKAQQGKALPSLKGKGFESTEDGKDYFAKVSGRIFLDNGRICVDPIYVVTGDLGIGHGNIKFNGDVEIRGDMHSGLQIDAEGSIFITGHVGNCKLNAKENVTIGDGIQGKYGCEINAGGDVAANFVEHCTIKAGGNIYANSLLNSTVYARESVIVTSKNGMIVGGNVRGIQAVHVKNLGNEAGVRTRVSFGETLDLVTEMTELKKRQKKVEFDISVFEEKAKVFDQTGVSFGGTDTKKLKRQIAQAKVLRQTEEKELIKEIEKLDDMIKRAKASAHVYVSGTIHSGVILTSDNASVVQGETMREIVFRKRYNAIETVAPEDFPELKNK